MARRANAALAFKSQSAFGTVASATGFQLLPFSTWDDGVTPNAVNDDTIRTSRFGAPDRPGTLTVTPTMECNLRTAAYDAIIAALFQNTFATDTLDQGSTPVWFAWEDRQSDAGSGSYILYQDLAPNTLRLQLALNQFIRATFGFIGTQVAASGTATASPVAAVTDAPLDTFTGGTLTYDGGALAVTALDLTMNNNIAAGYSMFSRYPDRHVGNLDQVNGSMTVAYDGPSRFQEMLANSSHALIFQSTYGTKGHTWTLPAIRLTTFSKPINTGAEVLQTIGFAADVGTSPATKVRLVRDNS